MRRRRTLPLSTLLILVLIALAYLYFNRGGIPVTGPDINIVLTTSTPTNPVLSTPQFGHRTKTAGCQVHASLPDSACTPGDIFPDVTREEICKPGYASSVRNVPDSVKEAVYAEYGIVDRAPGQYEIDHLVSLELGGSNDISNLFAQPASPTPGFHEKDNVENYLHDQVCSGAISLSQAQQEIATNWVAVYQNIPR